MKTNQFAFAALIPVLSGFLLTAPISLRAEEGAFRSSEIFGLSEMAKVVENYRPAGLTASTTLTHFLVLGEVNCPGEFEVGAPVNLLTALFAAGGPTAAGSMRRIEVYKNKELLGEFDLYDFLHQERISGDFVFNGGEEVVVPPAGPRVKISGQVFRSGIFEFKPANLQLAVAVDQAGGFVDAEVAYRVEILRSIGGFRRVFLAIEVRAGEKLPQMQLQDGDEINVTGTGEDMVVTMEGEVAPGRVVYREGLRLSEILRKSVRFREGAAFDYAEVLRPGSSDGNYEVIGFSPAALLGVNCPGDVIMRPGDRLVIFSKKFLEQRPLVFVEGQIKKQGMQAYEQGLTIKKLIEDAGGVQGSNLVAELSRREIKDGRLDFTCIEINLTAALNDDPRHNLSLKPFDSLKVIAP